MFEGQFPLPITTPVPFNVASDPLVLGFESQNGGLRSAPFSLSAVERCTLGVTMPSKRRTASTIHSSFCQGTTISATTQTNGRQNLSSDLGEVLAQVTGKTLHTHAKSTCGNAKG